MNPIRAAVERPLAVLAVVLMAVLAGLAALERIPIQLAPDVARPVISISTSWPGAAPVDMEREIVIRQEDALGGLKGLEQMSASARTDRARVTLEFAVGTDMDKAMQLVSNRLDRVTGYPDDAGRPSLDMAGNDDSPVAWFVLTRAPGNDRPITEYSPFLEEVLRARLERAPGVSRVDIYGAVERQFQVIVDPARLARYRMTIPDLAETLRRENVSLSAGSINEGKRRYALRAQGELNTLEALRGVVLRSGAADGAGRVRLGDLAELRYAYAPRAAVARFRGEPSLSVSVARETGTNVIAMMRALRAATAELADGPLARQGLRIRQIYDETVYIDAAIDLVTGNIWVGGALAALMLMLFLRSPRATLIVSLAIPVSVIATFVAMSALGRTLNVVSLAGIAFAVGMVVDAAIVVLENIWRLRQSGTPPDRAACDGARQVWGAILVSALTTVLVFLPILAMDLPAGQLFGDIAIAISASVLLSLAVAVTVIPALAGRLLAGAPPRRITLPLIDWLGRGFSAAIMAYARVTVRHPLIGAPVVALICAAALGLSWAALPKLEYLPEGARNLVFGAISPPPGFSLDATTAIATRVETAARPLWRSETDDPDGPPAIDAFSMVAFNGGGFVVASARDPARLPELIPILSRPIRAEPGASVFMTRPSLFGRGVGGGRAISLNVSAPTLAQLLPAARRAMALAEAALPPGQGTQIRARPGLELGAPELRLIPDRARLADAGMRAQALAASLQAFNGELRVAEVAAQGRRVDVVLRGRAPEAPEPRSQDIAALPIVTPSGRIARLDGLGRIELTAGPAELRRLEGALTITLQIRPPADLPLETALERLETQVMAPLRAEAGAGLDPEARFTLSGAADSLTRTWRALRLNLLFALAAVFLVMVVLFESFALPLAIMVSVPVAAAGGVGGLWLVNRFVLQPLDMLTLLGFVILIGVVVNNAILIAHQAQANLREAGSDVESAVLSATRDRIRPIFMSTLTSVFGMAPLVLFPGSGAELYRGLGAVVLGGLSLSAVLTLLVGPPLFRLALGGARGREGAR